MRLKAEDKKEGKPKLIPINRYVSRVLDEIEPEKRLSSEYVFTRNGKPIRDLNAYMRFLCKRAGVLYGQKVENGITFHEI